VGVDWVHRGEYIVAKHQTTPTQADEALDDPNAWSANDRDRRYYNQGGPDEQEP
jgi:hypothetical protein